MALLVGTARALGVAVVLWVLGGLLAVLIFHAVEEPWTLRLSDGTVRVQALWLGAQAFVGVLACGAGAYVGVSSLITSRHYTGRVAWLVVAVLLLAVCGAVLATMVARETLTRPMALTVLGGAAVGVVVGASAGVWRQEPDAGAWAAVAPRGWSVPVTTRSWGSRGR